MVEPRFQEDGAMILVVCNKQYEDLEAAGCDMRNYRRNEPVPVHSAINESQILTAKYRLKASFLKRHTDPEVDKRGQGNRIVREYEHMLKHGKCHKGCCEVPEILVGKLGNTWVQR